MKLSLTGLQQLGRALMLPIAVLPVAALMLRLGQPDLLGAPALAGIGGGAFGVMATAFAAAGGAVFGHLGLIFAVGVAVGLARENHGAAGLAGLVCFLVATEGAKALLQVPPDAATSDLAAAAWREKEIGKLSIPAGILSGVISGVLYNRFCETKLPDYLAFFGGRRFVPIVCGLAGVVLALVFGFSWPVLERGMDSLSAGVLGLGPLGLFLYGALNRLLIVTGLHHILNNLAWFLLGDFNGVTGDLNRFAAGDLSAGAFMSGFFPVMMFGLPAACLAMYHAALPERRKAVGGMLASLALTSFLTGVTEPIEFSFMFLAPVLYAVHAVMTGVSMALMDALGIRLGFGFSAGLFDYVLNFNKATKPWLLLPIGAAYFAVYYGLFRWAIRTFDLKTPGRDEAPAESAAPAFARPRGEAFAQALGGAANLAAVDACTTRLRLTIRDPSAVDEAALKALGARGVVRPSPDALQVVLGPQADQVAGEIRAFLASGAPASAPGIDPARVAAVLRGLDLAAIEVCDSRLRLAAPVGAIIDEAALKAAGVRGVFRRGGVLHLLIGPGAAALAAGLRANA